MHRPGHSNDYSSPVSPRLGSTGLQQPQAYADLVRQNLFYTSQLIKDTGNNYRGFSTAGAGGGGTTETPVIVPPGS
jgi:hypothetical protein